MIRAFALRHGAAAEQIDGKKALEGLLRAMEEGLAGRGKIPMIPSFLPPRIPAPAGGSCCVLDAGGTNLRVAHARFDDAGVCRLEQVHTAPMPGSLGRVSAEEFFGQLAESLDPMEDHQRVGFCFSYNVDIDPNLEGTLSAWCKEIDAPGVVGCPIGKSLAARLGGACRVRVLNDSVAAMLGASRPVRVGVVLGTGVNVCYPEPWENIPKLNPCGKGSMIISTEVGEFDAIPMSDFEREAIAETDDPTLAWAEKQCSGAYLGRLIALAWQQAAREGLLPEEFLEESWPLARVSGALAGMEPAPEQALEIARILICRAAKVAAILCAGPILRCSRSGETVAVAVEGSQYWRLTGFRQAFHRELEQLLADRSIAVDIVKTENACLAGAALAAFAEPGEE